MSDAADMTTANRLTLEALEVIADTATNSDTRTRILAELLAQHGVPKLRTQRGIVTIALMDDKCEERPAHLCGPLAIHKSMGEYAVSHRATGLRVIRCRSLACARVALVTLAAYSDWNFAAKADAPPNAWRLTNALRRIVG